MKIVLALGLALSSATLAAQPAKAPAAAAAAACDRECLRGKVSEVLYALVDHDMARLPVAATLRVTEDGVEKALDKVGLVRTVTKLRGYRQDIIDERAQQAVAGVMVEESGAPILLVVRVKLDGAENKYPHELSGGMRQRVSLARALCVDPDLILLDESFSQLDHVTSKALREDFAKVARQYNKTCLFVTHRIEDALEMSDRVIVLRPGAGIALEQSIDDAMRADESRLRELHQTIADRMGSGPAA